MNIKPIPEFQKYLISDTGIVYGQNSKPLFQRNEDNYKIVRITYNYQRINFSVHRLIAHTFLGLDLFDRLKLVHHKDGNPSNNCVDNLEILTPSEHTLKSYDHTRINDSITHKQCRKCKVIKDRSEFYISNKKHSDGYLSYCKSCCIELAIIGSRGGVK